MIYIIFDELGGGKTLTATYFAACYKKQGKQLFTNYHTKISDHHISSLEEMDKMNDGVFICDDAYNWMSSRNIKENKGINKILSVSRKRKLDIFITTVRPMQIDINIRYNVKYCFMPKIILGKSTKFPLLMLIRQFPFFPEYSEPEKQLGKGKTVKILNHKTLKYICDLYDTKEEIQKLSDTT